MVATIDVTGQKFGRLTVLHRDRESKKRGIRYICQCECGTIKSVFGESLRRGATKSCGCLNSETASRRNRETKVTHGQSYGPEYQAWRSMISRCRNPSHQSYSRYGARGIVVCEEWQSNFQKFFDHVGKRPSPQHSIDRIDNAGNYEPGNVHWATAKEQGRNRSDNRMLEFMGETRSVAEWAERFGLPYRVLYSRIWWGWEIERALVTPIRDCSLNTRISS